MNYLDQLIQCPDLAQPGCCLISLHFLCEICLSSAFIGSILNFTILIFGFIAGNTFERFGARLLMISGGSVALAGYVASAFAPSVVFLYFRDRIRPLSKMC